MNGGHTPHRSIAAAAMVVCARFAVAQCNPLEQAILSDPDSGDASNFGYCAAISLDTAVVGAYLDHAAYVYVRGNGLWTQQGVLSANDSGFGVACAISGDTIVIGAPSASNPNAPASGAAFVFVCVAGVWTFQARLSLSDPVSGDYFGHTAAISADTLVVGAPNRRVAGIRCGVAYVYVRAGGDWMPQATLVSADPAASDKFGYRVALQGDSALIGAYAKDVDGLSSAGAAYVFTRSGGVWAQQARLTASEPAAHDGFGIALGLSDDTAVIGCFQDDNTGGVDAGSAHVFVRSGGIWSRQAVLTASDAAPGDRFGSTAALEGDTAVVSAFTSSAPAYSSGSAYVFTRSGGAWTQRSKLVASDAAENDTLGDSLAISAGTVIAGASGADAAYVFVLNCTHCDPCDANCDGSVNPFDIQPFVELLNGTGSACAPCAADANHDGSVDQFDIQEFVVCLLG